MWKAGSAASSAASRRSWDGSVISLIVTWIAVNRGSADLRACGLRFSFRLKSRRPEEPQTARAAVCATISCCAPRGGLALEQSKVLRDDIRGGRRSQEAEADHHAQRSQHQEAVRRAGVRDAAAQEVEAQPGEQQD